MKEKQVLIEGMRCIQCSLVIEEALNKLAGVQALVKLYESKAKLILTEEISDEKLCETIEDLGFKVVSIY
jgi:copper chaperone CopZ